MNFGGTTKIVLIALTLITIYPSVNAKEGKTFQTKGVGVITRNSTFKFEIERKVTVPEFFDVDAFQDLNSLRHDRQSGWTKCRVPLKSEMGLTGPVERSLVFDCIPLTYR